MAQKESVSSSVPVSVVSIITTPKHFWAPHDMIPLKLQHPARPELDSTKVCPRKVLVAERMKPSRHQAGAEL